jgi:regulator of sigma E protease
MNLLDYLFAVIPMLGILIFVHEFGHFIVAKACGVRVLKFSLGFGAPIGIGNMRLRWERGGTEYVIGWFPLGGFVKMLGEEMAGVQGEEDIVIEDAAPDEYLQAKPTWQKLAIILAGPAMNLVLPVFIFIGVLAVGLPQPSPVIGNVEPHSPARDAGLLPGDRIVEIAGVPTETWDDVDSIVRERSGYTLGFVVDRAGEEVRAELPVSGRTGMDAFGDVVDIGWLGIGHRRLDSLLGFAASDTPGQRAGLLSGDRVIGLGADPEVEIEDWMMMQAAYRAAFDAGLSQLAARVERLDGEETIEIETTIPVLPTLADLGVIPATILVRTVSPDMPAAEAGLEPGDLILGVDGEPVGSFATFAEIVRSSQGRELEITYARRGETLSAKMSARESSVPGPLEIEGMEQKVFLIGIRPELATLAGAQHVEKIWSPLVSVPRAVSMTVEVSAHFLKGMSKLASGDVGLDNVAGPIGIAEVARKSLDLGWMAYLSTLILISVNLAFLNLLPIPILDGGQALIFAVEGIKRSPISVRSREVVQQIGLTFLMMLMGLAFWNDLSRHWSSFVEWIGGIGS